MPSATTTLASAFTDLANCATEVTQTAENMENLLKRREFLAFILIWTKESCHLRLMVSFSGWRFRMMLYVGDRSGQQFLYSIPVDALLYQVYKNHRILFDAKIYN